jgi:hypothetical protein
MSDIENNLFSSKIKKNTTGVSKLNLIRRLSSVAKFEVKQTPERNPTP